MTNGLEFDHFEANLTMLPTAEGGRRAPIQTGYAPNWWLPRGESRELASAAIELVDADELPPGGAGRVRIYPFAPELWREVVVGGALEMTEGPQRPKGIATITRVVPDLTPTH